MDRTFRSAKNRSQGREGWCILFRHPLRHDGEGKPLRVRRGLGTKDDAEADGLVEQMNRLLGEESYWTPSAADRALREGFDPRVVDIFYDGIEGGLEDPWVVRDAVILLPTKDEGYTRVLLVGSTGAGKTTLLRQLIGSDPQRDRFPSTSTAKTTVFDTEIVIAEGPFRAVVSFLSRDRVRHYIEECVISAISVAAEGAEQHEVGRRLLEHSEQRFRLSYMLGQPANISLNEQEADDDEEPTEPLVEEAEVGDQERQNLVNRLREYLERVTKIAESVRTALADQLSLAPNTLGSSDRDAFQELLEDKARESDEAQSLIDDIQDDVESRFQLLQQGECDMDRSGWPIRWTFETDDRAAFIKAVNRFSSNYARNFGRLLTPLVQGLRVAGPFNPAWSDSDGSGKFVFLDGEGLGHTPDSAWSLPTSMTRRYDIADVILLVDSATQPMLAGAQAVLRSVGASGHDSKLAIVFTHFDHVKGDNLPNKAAKMNHIQASLDNAIQGIDAVLGPGAARNLKRHLEGRVFFLAGIDRVLHKNARFTRSQLGRLVAMLSAAAAPSKPVEAVPIYDTGNLVLAVHIATQQYHEAWAARLGLAFKVGVQPEHWTRIKALSRRFAEQWADEYDNLRPVADVIRLLQEQLAVFIATPRNWEPPAPPEDIQEAAVDRVAREVYSRLHEMVSNRLLIEPLKDWVRAYTRRGTGSGRARAQDIEYIYDVAVPVPGTTPARESNEFLDVVRKLFREAALAAGAKII